MQSKTYLLSLLFLILTNFAFAQPMLNNRLLFVANMNGGQEVPAVTTDARGVATFLLSEDLSGISVHGVFSGLSGPITGCHIHDGLAGAAGPVLVNYSSSLDGNRLRATTPVSASLLTKALKNGLYLNVHTAANPAGEIRGQIELVNDIQYAAIMNGLAEVPPNLSTATGVFRLTYSPGDFEARYIGSYNGLSGPATAAHIHNGAAGVSGPVVVPLSAGLPSTLVGEIDLTAVPPDFTQKLEQNLLYVNIHTAANPAGEIRGQLHSLGPITFETFLNGDQETPPVSTSAIGTAVAGLAPTLDTLTYFVSATGLSGPPTAAHFHFAPAGMAGPVIVGLTATPAPNFYAGKVVLTTSQVVQLLSENIYVNVHTAANPAGEIRGQMQSNLRRVYAFDLCGQQEVPANASAGIGAAVISTDRGNQHLSYLYIVDGLSGPATAAHVHDGAFGAGGPVYLPVNVPGPVGSGQFQITGLDAVKLESGNTYLNVHTAAFPGGEIRGQVRRELSCAPSVANQTPVISGLKIFPNPTSGMTEIQAEMSESFEGKLILTDLLGQTLRSENHAFEGGSQTLRLDLGGMPVGLYLVQIKSNKGGLVGAFKVAKD